MPSKGVDYYLYFDADDLSTEVTGPKVGGKYDRAANFRRNQFQLHSANLPWNIWMATLRWVTRRGADEVIRHHQNIHTNTGNLDEGTMRNMFATPPKIGDTTVSWGFYDAGNGVSGLTNRHQLYVYATRDQRRWMSDLAARNPRVQRGPFARFALPGAHDAGMFDMTAVDKILDNVGLYAALMAAVALLPLPIGPILAVVGRIFAPYAIANLSMTQKDNVRAMLDVGTRFFDFRPGKMHASLSAFTPGVRYHQHGVIPGYPYVAFLVDVLRWLEENPGEIVVVNANTQGFAADAMKPSAADLANDLKAAFAKVPSSNPVVVGERRHLEISYEELVRTNTRLIFLNQIAGETSKYDSWNGSYATLRPGPIIEAFKAMKREMPPHPKQPTDVPTGPMRLQDYVVMQMQATSTNIKAVAAASVFSTSRATSPLLATKATMDVATNPWLREHAASRLPPDHLLVLLNDFVDNCMTETAIMVTEQRARD